MMTQIPAFQRLLTGSESAGRGCHTVTLRLWISVCELDASLITLPDSFPKQTSSIFFCFHTPSRARTHKRILSSPIGGVVSKLWTRLAKVVTAGLLSGLKQALIAIFQERGVSTAMMGFGWGVRRNQDERASDDRKRQSSEGSDRICSTSRYFWKTLPLQ